MLLTHRKIKKEPLKISLMVTKEDLEFIEKCCDNDIKFRKNEIKRLNKKIKQINQQLTKYGR